MQVLLLAAALLCSVLGFAWLALAMDVHWAQARGAQPAPTGVPRVLRALGAAALAASLVLCLRADHASMAALVWVMALAAGALLVALALAWRPRWLAPLVAWVPRAAAAPQADGRAG
ncbi:MAG: DUF3325 family protein [Pseudomonadota bacterium]